MWTTSEHQKLSQHHGLLSHVEEGEARLLLFPTSGSLSVLLLLLLVHLLPLGGDPGHGNHTDGGPDVAIVGDVRSDLSSGHRKTFSETFSDSVGKC